MHFAPDEHTDGRRRQRTLFVTQELPTNSSSAQRCRVSQPGAGGQPLPPASPQRGPCPPAREPARLRPHGQLARLGSASSAPALVAGCLTSGDQEPAESRSEPTRPCPSPLTRDRF